MCLPQFQTLKASVQSCATSDKRTNGYVFLLDRTCPTSTPAFKSLANPMDRTFRRRSDAITKSVRRAAVTALRELPRGGLVRRDLRRARDAAFRSLWSQAAPRPLYDDESVRFASISAGTENNSAGARARRSATGCARRLMWLGATTGASRDRGKGNPRAARDCARPGAPLFDARSTDLQALLHLFPLSPPSPSSPLRFSTV